MDYLQVKEQIKQKLPNPIDFKDTENLLELGLSSLVIMRLVNQWRKRGIKVSFGSLMEHPTFQEWWGLIQKAAKKTTPKKSKSNKEKIDTGDMYQEFPLTDVQYAYWVGRDDGQVLGGVGCHAYLEFDGESVNPERLQSAWNIVQYHHSMLRDCFPGNGLQKIMSKPYSEKIRINDFSSLSEAEAKKAALSVRDRLSHRKLQIEKGEVAGIELTLLPQRKTRVHIDIDLLVADVQSLHIILRDLATAYSGGQLPDESKAWNFAAYLQEQEEEESDEREQAKAYWKKRLDILPKGPELPMAKRPEEIRQPIFKRRIVRIGKKEWERLQARAKEYKTTPAMLLLTAYATVLERWSQNKRFLINIPYFNRNTEKQGLEEVVADFTTLLLLEVNCEGTPTFLELLHRIERQLHEDMKHTAYSGVQVQRNLSRIYGESAVSAPVVFACNLGTPLIDSVFQKSFGEFSYMISQTPQVWNDFQSYEDEKGVQLTWDSVDELFPETMIQDMMDRLKILLHDLGKEDWNQKFDVLPEKRKKFLEESCVTEVPEKPQCLHTAFLQSAKADPGKAALIDTGKGYTITYGELREKALGIAKMICGHEIIKEPIAITLPRGYEQITAALGILMSGNLYIPVSLNQPKDRRKLIHEKTGVKYVITNNAWKDQIEWPDQTEIFNFDEIDGTESAKLPEVFPEDSAYIIMTSGSTGVPKGVEIAHGSAWNTIQDINKKYMVSSKDTALAVSAMDFDLSVYDVFGILGAGGSLVLLPDAERRNADYWIEQIKKYHVSFLNCVPTLLNMLLIRAEALQEKLPLRAVLLSGDWIGLDLPERVAALTDSCEFVALGGATEASIWSNYQDVKLPIPAGWKSIPYGQPLEHQSYRIVDEYGRDCPYWVPGELWIGGYGVAKGYRGDRKLTEQKFILDSKGRWYRTGDLGRFWQDGTIEFLGRRDYQVKIRGHRIELGEIEHAIGTCKGVDQAVVDTFSDGNGNKSLVAYIGATLEKDSGVVSCIKGKDIFGETWEQVTEVTSKWNPEREMEEAYKKFIAYGNQCCIQTMLAVLEEMEIITSDKSSCSKDEILSDVSIDQTQKQTIIRWLDVLLKENFLRDEKGKLIRTDKQIDFSENVAEVNEYLQKLKPYIKKIVTGQESPLDVFYEKDPTLAPAKLISRVPGHEKIGEILDFILKQLCRIDTKEPIQILEIGTRDSRMTKKLANQSENTSIVYTYADTSKYFLQEMKDELYEFEGIEYEILNLNKSLDQQQIQKHRYDIVISANALHQNQDVTDALEKISDLLKPNGIFLMTEFIDTIYLQEFTASFLENGFSNIKDKREETGIIMPDYDSWREYLDRAGLTERFAEMRGYGSAIFVCRQRGTFLDYDADKLRNYLSEKLPDYMIPQNYHFMSQLPTLSNGKIDRKTLQETFKGESVEVRFSRATTETEHTLLVIWQKLFGYKTLGIEDNYFALGGDSLVATRLISEIQKIFNCKISIGAIFENPTIKALAKVIDQTEHELSSTLEIRPDLVNRYKPFPLTDVQYAYWIGRSGLYELGNVATHCYFELDTEKLDIKKAERAWNMLIKRHGMMRVIIRPDGTQEILESVPDYQIKIQDVHALDKAGKDQALYAKREEMSHQVIDTENWPLFDVEITELGEDRQRIHISFDNLIFDGWSMFHILNEWTEVYKTGCADKEINLSFRDYVLGLEEIKRSSSYEADKKYWEERADNFSPAPNFPLAKTEKQITEQRFCRRSDTLSPEEWKTLKELAGEIGVTPSVLLISAYAETIRLWSDNKDFTLNLTQFDRKQIHPEVNALIGDFTTLTLLEIHDNEGKNFEMRARAIQKQLSKDMEHSSYSAVELERELKKRQGNPQGSIMPVVFTSGLGVEQWNEGKWLGKLHYNISQTPQVWLDHQVVEMDGGLCLFWDSVDELFYPGMLDEMFRAYTGLLKKLSKRPETVKKPTISLVSAEISEARYKANETSVKFEEKTLDDLFWEAAEKWPDKEALVSTNRRMTYREIQEEALYISEQLRQLGVKKGETVGILMEKGWEQIVAVYGILFAGAAYLPIDIHNPQNRIEKILYDSSTKVILVQNSTLNDQMKWLNDWDCIPVCGLKDCQNIRPGKNKPEDLAYVIYTSGSTGIPKGVMITHLNAINTIFDVNNRFYVTKEDVAFGISNLHFDLSAYDILGILGVGGKLVLPGPDRIKEPAYWIELLNTEKITLWNSVPAFVEMLVEYEEYQKKIESQSLRLVMMSGDWIPVSLPDRMRRIFPTVKLQALGGATEASIWSNSFEIPDVIPENWKSIPYGKPLANQRYYVLDLNMKNCPDWVPGMLYIAGDGVACGYLNDKKRTEEKFVIWKETGERLYRTGDLGRYWGDSNIEFLGRIDSQIKLNGYRIELGEIERAILENNALSNAYVVLIQKCLYAVVTFKERITQPYNKIADIKERLAQKLPSYFIPHKIIVLKNIPITTNGKIDRNAIVQIIEQKLEDEYNSIDHPIGEAEERIAEVWKEVLGLTKVSRKEDFFESGGDSLKAMSFVNKLNARNIFYDQLTLTTLFSNATIEKLARELVKVNSDNVEEGTL